MGVALQLWRTRRMSRARALGLRGPPDLGTRRTRRRNASWKGASGCGRRSRANCCIASVLYFSSYVNPSEPVRGVAKGAAARPAGKGFIIQANLQDRAPEHGLKCK